MPTPHLPEVAFVPVRDGAAYRGEVIDVHNQQRLVRTNTTYANPADARSAATSLWRARQAALLRELGHHQEHAFA